MNAERGMPDTGPAGWALRSTSAWLSQPRGRPAHHGGIRGPQTAALHNSLWPETLTPSLHLPAGPTKTPEASSGYPCWCCGHPAPKSREPKAQPRVGLDPSTGGLHRRAATLATCCAHPLLSASRPPKTQLRQDSRSESQSRFPYTKTF